MFLIHLRVLGCGTGDSMGMRCAVETYCPRGRLVHAVEYETLDQARAAYEAELAAMPESLPALRWAGQQLARTKPLHDLQTREWERSMNDTLHGRDPVGLGLPWSHPEAARAWGSLRDDPKRSGRKRRW
jgi:hypothetical protein